MQIKKQADTARETVIRLANRAAPMMYHLRDRLPGAASQHYAASRCDGRDAHLLLMQIKKYVDTAPESALVIVSQILPDYSKS